MTRRLRLRLAYDGTDFVGWQMQTNGRSVQEVLEKAFEIIHGHPVRSFVAGRTDSGVHARGQVVHFDSDATVPVDRFPMALNSELPRDVRVIACREAARDFDARRSAARREYQYYIEPAEFSDPFTRRWALTLKSCPPITTMNACASQIIGSHDFTTFSAIGDQSESKTRRVYSAGFHIEGRLITFRIAANAFLWKMVRSIVGTILESCAQKKPSEAMSAALHARSRTAVGATVPAKGLFLNRVIYDY